MSGEQNSTAQRRSAAPARLAEPVRPEDLRGAFPGGDVDAAGVRQGLDGRIRSSLSRYAANVRERELRSADLAADVALQRRKPELDAALEGSRRRLETQVSEARAQAADELRRLRLRVSVLENRAKRPRPYTPEQVAADLAAAQAQLDSLQKKVDSRVADLRAAQAQEEKDITSRWQAESDALREQRRQAALQKADEQVRLRTEQSGQAEQGFLRGLRKRPDWRPQGVPALDERLGRATGPTGNVTGRVSQAEARVRDMVQEDASLASSLAGGIEAGQGKKRESAGAAVRRARWMLGR